MLFRKELLKIGISAAAGLILSLFLLAEAGWPALLILPLYAIGTVYAFRYVLRACTAVFTWFANMLGISSATFNLLGCLASFILGAIGLTLTLGLTWIIGIFIAVYRLYQAFQEQRIVQTPGRSPHSQLPGDGGDDWDTPPAASDDWGF